MANFRASKVVSSLPGTLDTSTMYLVRVGAGFDFYASDSTGSLAFKLNSPAWTDIQTKPTTLAGFGITDAAPSSHVGSGGAAHANVVAAGAAGFMTGADKTKLDGIAAGAEVNVNADWNAVSGDAQILNKPTLGTAAAAATTDFAAASHVGSSGASHAVATTSVAGFLSAADKTKLDGVATGANNYVHPNHSGDVTSVADGATTIAAGVVTNAKLANVATATIKGRTTAGTGSPEDLTPAQARTVLSLVAIATSGSAADLTTGLLPAARFDDTAHGTRAGGTTHAVATTSVAGFMSAADKTKLDGVATGANNYVHPNHSGDVTSVADGATTIAAGVVTNAKLANVATATIKGRTTAGTGSPEDLTPAQARTVLSLATIATSASAADLTTGLLPAARFDDTAHGARAGGTTHAAATTSVAGFMSAADKTKLDGVATGATANSSDATLLNRANHTGTQLAATVSDFAEAVDDRVSSLLVAGSNITLTYNDAANTLTVASTVTGGGTPYIISATAPDPATYPLWIDLSGSAFAWDGAFWFEIIGQPGAGLPTGGTTGQVLSKSSATDYDYAWGAPTVDWTAITSKPSTFTPSAHTHAIADVTGLTAAIAAKQDTLVSATNIKTINGSSILGSGDLSVAGGSSNPALIWVL